MTAANFTVYQYNKQSPHKEYVGIVILSEENGDKDYLESELQEKDIFIIPGDCTKVIPGPDLPNKKQVYLGFVEDPELGLIEKWDYVDDYVGTNFWDEDGNKFTITEYNVTVPEGMLLSEPPPKLEKLQYDKIMSITDSYRQDLYADIEVTTSNNVTAIFKADSASQNLLVATLQGYKEIGSVPEGFYWVAENNDRIPFTLDDLKALYAAILDRGWTLFQKYQDKKTAVRNANTPTKVKNVKW